MDSCEVHSAHLFYFCVVAHTQLRYFETPRTWAAARGECLREGGDLVSITSIGENLALQAYLSDLSTFQANAPANPTTIWLGLYDAVSGRNIRSTVLYDTNFILANAPRLVVLYCVVLRRSIFISKRYPIVTKSYLFGFFVSSFPSSPSTTAVHTGPLRFSYFFGFFVSSSFSSSPSTTTVNIPL